MFNSIFKIVYFIEFLVVLVIRKTWERKFVKLGIETKKNSTVELIFLLLNGVGMIVPLVYVCSSWLDFANYTLPNWLGWVGTGLFAFAIWFLWRTHYDLGRNWTPTVSTRSDHTLVTDGVYRIMRHPMYSSHLLWAIAQIMILHNWIAGYSFIVVQIPFCILRIRNEEKHMVEQFGDAYEAYMNATKRIIPKVL